MKKIFISLMLSMAAFLGANAMSFERAQAEALYLTDKMAYELNLNEQQYNDAYEINLDYFLRVDSPSDIYGDYYSYRLNDLRCILHDWQYTILSATDYFLRPIAWRVGGWYFPIYSYYNRTYFYYGRPSVWRTYYGGHSRHYHHAGFYTHRRPVWNGGLRGHDMRRPDMHHPSAGSHRPSVGSHHSSAGSHRPSSGMSGHRDGVNRPGNNHSSHSSFGGSGRSSHGNSFDSSSSKMGGNHGGGSHMNGNRGGSSHMSGSHGNGSHMGGSRGGGGNMGHSRGGGRR